MVDTDKDIKMCTPHIVSHPVMNAVMLEAKHALWEMNQHHAMLAAVSAGALVAIVALVVVRRRRAPAETLPVEEDAYLPLLY